MASGTAEVGTAAILQVLQEWGVTAEHLLCCCFDTTSTNSGANAGIMVRLERALGRKLMHLYCRHHSYERLFASVETTLKLYICYLGLCFDFLL